MKQVKVADRLSADKTAELIALGVDAGMAGVEAEGARVFALADMLSLLPKWVKYRNMLLWLEIGIDEYSDGWYVRYQSSQGIDEADTFVSAEKLVDALYLEMKHLITEGIIKL